MLILFRCAQLIVAVNSGAVLHANLLDRILKFVPDLFIPMFNKLGTDQYKIGLLYLTSLKLTSVLS